MIHALRGTRRRVLVAAVVLVIIFYVGFSLPRRRHVQELHDQVMPGLAEMSVAVLVATSSESVTAPVLPSAAAPELSISSTATTPAEKCVAYDHGLEIVVALKTGATEAFTRVPPSILTFLQCPKSDLLLFSDMEQEIGDYHIFDALDTVAEAAKVNNADFDLYHKQMEYRLAGDVVGSLSHRGGDAWKLDKYKNIHIAQKAWKMQPNKSWYFFIDADTYVFWSTLFRWLKRLDPAERLYLGSAVWIGQPPYAHGGSGYVLSRTALAELVGADGPELATNSDIHTRDYCCGDEALAKVLFDSKGLNVTNARPVMNGHRLREIPFGPTRWCQPVATMHHSSPEEMNDLWAWEQQRKNPLEPVTMAELFTAIESKFIPERENWHNGNFELTLEPKQNKPNFRVKFLKRVFDFLDLFNWGGAWKSFDNCKIACTEDPNCISFLHYGQKCVVSASYRLGAAKMPENGMVYRSGWDVERFAAWRTRHSPCESLLWDPDDA